MSQNTSQYIIGIDEAGRGPLAGPVAIGVSCIPKEFQKEVFSILKKAGLNDSKQVKEKTREELYDLLIQLKKEKKLDWAVSLVSADIISKKGIVYAIDLGIRRGLDRVIKNYSHEASLARHPRVDGDPPLDSRLRGNDDFFSFHKQTTLELDGALKIPQGNWKKASIIIKGDSIKPSIMIASILAKVTRDKYMKKVAKKYPEYNFEIHKGYGTKKHRELITQFGLSKEHRIGWCKSF